MGVEQQLSLVPRKVFRDQLITIADLDAFKQDLLISLTRLFKEQQEKPQKKWVKSYEVKQILNISHGTLQTLRNTGTLPFSKIGNIVYYDMEDISRIMLENKRPFAKKTFNENLTGKTKK